MLFYPLSSRAQTRDPVPRSMDDEACGDPDVRPLGPGSALRFARKDSPLLCHPLSSRAKTRDPVPRSMADEDSGDRTFGRRVSGRRFALPGRTVRCSAIRCHPGRRPGIQCRGRWLMRLPATRTFGRWVPGRRFALPGMTVRCSYSPLSSRAKTRDPVPRAMDDEACGGPDVRPLGPGSAFLFAPGRQSVAPVHRRHPGRRPGIQCRGRWMMRLATARAFGRWVPGRRFSLPG